MNLSDENSSHPEAVSGGDANGIIDRIFGCRFFAPAVLCFAFLVRLVYLVETTDSPFFDIPMVDAHFNNKWAKDIVAGDWLSLEYGVLWKPPLYPYLLALVYAIFGPSIFMAKLIQVLAALAGYYVLYLIGRQHFGPVAAGLGLCMASLYGTFIHFEGELEVVTMVTFFNILALYLLSRDPMNAGPLQWFGAGLVLALSALVRPTILLFVPMALVWIFFIFGRVSSPGKALKPVILVILGVVLLIAPVTIRNYVVGKELVLISGNGGINLYLGNNSDYEEGLAIREGLMWDRLVTEPFGALGKEKLTFAEEDRYWVSKVKDFMVAEPAAFTGLLLKKAALFWHGYEIKRNKDIYFAKRYSVILGLPLLGFAMVAPLALIGMALTLPRWREFMLLHLYVLYVMSTTVIFFVCARYRLPVVPILILFAGYGLYRLFVWGSSGQWKKVSAFVAAFVSLLVLLNIDFFDVREKTFARSHYNLGLIYSVKGEPEMAIAEFERALELNPPERLENAETYMNLGILHDELGDKERAVFEFKRAIALLPDYVKARAHLGKTYHEQGLFTEAIREFEAALAQSQDVSLYFDLAASQVSLKRYDGAIRSYESAIRLEPGSPGLAELHFALASLYDDLGLYESALSAYDLTIRYAPRHGRAYNNIGIIYGRMGRLGKAIQNFNKALEINPADKTASANLLMARDKLDESR